MSNGLWNINLPVKLFDKDLNDDNLFDFIAYDEVMQELLTQRKLFIVMSQDNQYVMHQMADIIGIINVVGMEGSELFANIDILLSTPNGRTVKELYTMLHTENNPIFYLTPHGVKDKGKIVSITSFTLWYKPSHGSLGNMNMLEQEGDNKA